MKISLITVNFNGAPSTIRLLNSLKNQTDQDFEVIVVDNLSTDVHQLKEYSGFKFHLIENKSNLGFAGGNNPGLDHVFTHQADWAVLINNDSWVDNDFMTRLKAGLERREGVVGLPLQEGNKTAFGGSLDWLRTTMDHSYAPISTEDAELHYPIGGGMAISKKAYETISGLDEEYFLYFEDVDYAMKARAWEIPVEFLTAPRIHHSVSETTSKLGSALLLRYHYRNALHLNFKRGSMLTQVLVWPWSVGILIKQIIKIIGRRNLEESYAIFAGVVDFYQDNMGKIWQDKLRIGIECENLEDGQSRWGVGNLTLNLLREYANSSALQERYELVLYFKKAVPPDLIFQNPCFKTRVLGTGSFNFFYHILLPLNAMRDRVDWMFFPAYMLPPLYVGRSVVMLTGDVYYEYKHGSLPFKYKLAYRLFTNWAARTATKIMAISESSKKEVAKLYKIGPAKIFTARLGTNSIPVNKPNERGDYILYIGQMFPRRHALESLLAFEKISSEMQQLSFVMVGKDKYPHPTIEAHATRINKKLGRDAIIHYDYIEKDEDIRALYAHAKLFVYISSNEAFGLPPVEAAGYGVPVVVQDSEINHELFGNAAFFVKDPKDISALADLFRDALEDTKKREQMTEEYKEIIPKLSWHKFATTFFENLN